MDTDLWMTTVDWKYAHMCVYRHTHTYVYIYTHKNIHARTEKKLQLFQSATAHLLSKLKLKRAFHLSTSTFTTARLGGNF